MTRQNPYQQEIGYVACRENALTGGYCILYDGQKTGLDITAGRWVMMCSQHGSMMHGTNKRIATSLLRDPSSWCDSCKQLAEMEEAEYVLTLKATRPTDEQLRRLANLAIGDPEKCQLFERLTGKQPEHYLSQEFK